MAARRKKRLELLDRSRAQTERVIRDAFESAQGTVRSRLGSAREQATETWDNLEALFQSRVRKALQQIGVPTADEIRLLTRRVEELNDAVRSLTARQVRRGAKQAPARTAGKARSKTRGTTRRRGSPAGR